MLSEDMITLIHQLCFTCNTLQKSLLSLHSNLLNECVYMHISTHIAYLFLV